MVVSIVVMLAPFPRPKGRFQPSDQFLGLLLGQPSFRMKAEVIAQRHRTLPDFTGGFIGVALRLVELREVELGPSVLDVLDHSPGNRGDVRVPRPLRLVTVAVETGAPGQFLDPGRTPLGGTGHRRVRVIPPPRYELQPYEYQQKY